MKPATARAAVEAMDAAARSCAEGPPEGTSPLIADIMARAALEHYVAACVDAGRWLPRVLTEAERYRLAWASARQRAADHLAALVEADAERDHLAVQLRERDEEVRDLVSRLAEFSGITS